MAKRKVLYVDDEVVNLQLFEIIFKNKYNILVAENGMAGLDVISKNKDVEVVITDMNMPNMTGVEFITRAKQFGYKITYFILTGYEISDEIKNSLKLGLIEGCFRKPFNANELETAISGAVKI